MRRRRMPVARGRSNFDHAQQPGLRRSQAIQRTYDIDNTICWNVAFLPASQIICYFASTTMAKQEQNFDDREKQTGRGIKSKVGTSLAWYVIITVLP
jgi:hypothetical protein